MGLIYEDLTEVLIGCIYDVHKKIGTGYDEEAYHQGLIRRFREEDIPFVSKERKWLLHRNIQIKCFELDFLTFDKIIISLKCIQSDFLQPHYVQMISELKLWKKHLGFMVNFGIPRVNIKRIPFTEKKKELFEDYSYVKNRMTVIDRKIMHQLREAIIFVYNCHGLGYGKTVYKKLIIAELTHRKINFNSNVQINIKYDDEIIRTFNMRFLLVKERIILGVTALQSGLNYEIITIQTYLRALGLSIGLLVNFGKTRLELIGVHG